MSLQSSQFANTSTATATATAAAATATVTPTATTVAGFPGAADIAALEATAPRSLRGQRYSFVGVDRDHIAVVEGLVNEDFEQLPFTPNAVEKHVVITLKAPQPATEELGTPTNIWQSKIVRPGRGGERNGAGKKEKE
jgi:hypothetical protein